MYICSDFIRMEKTERTKPWERPWTTDEIRQESSNWNLAGDAGLLNHLQQFSQALLQKTHATEVALDNLMDDMKNTTTEISNVTNRFLSLANTQFVENRVYDDDEKETPTEEKKEEKAKSKEEQEAEVVARVKEALAIGMSILDTHFDAVEVPASDSEEEESSASTGRIILEPRNPYMSRPLPFIIGSKEFMEDDHVGLGDYLSDTEESPDQNLVQSSESDSDIDQENTASAPKRSRLSSSSVSENSEPESDRSGTHVKQRKHKAGSSVFASAGSLEEEGDMFGRESPPEADVDVGLKGSAPNSFAAELANKLGGVVADEREPQKQKPEKTAVADNLFSPPSESEEDDSLFGRRASKFSGGRGLFDDLDDWNKPSDSLWDNEKEQAADISKQTEKVSEPRKVPTVEGDSLFSPTTASDDLFGSGKVKEEEDIFSTGTKINNQAATAKIISSSKQNMFTSTPRAVTAGKGLFDGGSNEPFGSKGEPSNVGTKGSSLFDGADLDDGDLFAIPTSSGKKEKIKEVSLPTAADAPQDVAKKKKPVGGVSIFGNVDLFHDKISPVLPRPPSSSSESDTSEKNRGMLISSSSGMSKTSSDVQNRSSQNVTSDDVGRVLLFNNEKEDLQPTLTSTGKSDLFREEKTEASLFDKQNKETKEIIGARNPSTVKAPNPLNIGAKLKKPVSLFDESDSGDDELLFSSTSSTSSRSRRSQGSGDLLASAAEKKPLQKKGLFDDEDLLFGGSQDEPGFDIFHGDGVMKGTARSSIPKLVPEEKNVSDDLFGSNSQGARKTGGLFENSNDGMEDIFAITVKSKDTANYKASDTLKDDSNKTSIKGHLFSDSDTVDIFSVGISKSSEVTSETNATTVDIFSSNILQGDVDDIFSTSKDVNRKLSPNTTITESGEKRPIPDLRVEETKEKRSGNTSNKPSISQKPKIASTKPSLFGNSEENKRPKVSKVRDAVKSEEILEDKEKTTIKHDHLSSVKQEKQMETKHENDASQTLESSSQEVGKETLESSKLNFDFLSHTSSLSKPEPPKTLNIRKTTDVLFGSSSNEDEDMFATSWTSGEKITGSVEQPTVSRSALSSNTLSAILDDYSSVANKDVVDGCAFGTEKRAESENEISHKAESSLETRVPVKAKSVEPSPTFPSRRKLHIDPTALLPGANPPSRTVHLETAVSFDQPAETSTTLHSAAKERAKIQVKRKPSTRRARLEALRISSIDQDVTDSAPDNQLINSNPPGRTVSEDEILAPSNTHISIRENGTSPSLDIYNKPVISSKPVLDNAKDLSNVMSDLTEQESPDALRFSVKPVAPKPPLSELLGGNSNPLSPSTDEEDFFAVPQDLPSEYGNNKDQTTDDSKNLFGGAPVISPVDFNSRTVLYGGDMESHSRDATSGDLFSSVDERQDSSETVPKEPIVSSENLFTSNVPETKKDIFPGNKDWKGETTVKGDVGIRNPLDEEFRNKSISLDDDSDLFGSSKSATPTNTQNLFSTVRKEAISNGKDGSKTVNSGKKAMNLFPSVEDADLFSSESITQKNSVKDVDNPFNMKENVLASDEALFSAVESDPNDLFSVSNKATLNKSSTTKPTSDDLFPSSKGRDDDNDDDDNSIFSSGIKEHRSLLQTEAGGLFASDDSRLKSDISSDLFSSRIKDTVSKNSTDVESEDGIFSNKVRDGTTHRTLTGVNTPATSLFGDDSPESDDLFSSSIVTSKKKTGPALKSSTSRQGSLFDDSDNIFGTSSMKSVPKTNIIRSVAMANEESGDLFSSTMSQKKTLPKASSKQTIPAQSREKEEDLFEDPLMVIKK